MLKNFDLETILNNLTMGIVILDKKRNFIYINDITEKITGYSMVEIKNLKDWFKIAFPDPKKREEIYIDFKQKLENGDYYNRVTKIKTKSGQYKYIEFRVNPIEKGYLLVNLVDVSRRIDREERIKFLSYHDPLTNIYNRRYFENEMKRLDDSRLYPISIIIGDLDNLKTVNDNYGHSLGDDYLKKSAEILNNLLRAEEIVARIGGDEFAILLPKTGVEETNLLCKRIIKEFDSYNAANDFPVDFRISLGCSTAEKSNKKLSEIFNQADQNMYKNKGRK